jgi:hypothetical protein
LCDKYPEYYSHFKRCVQNNIEVLLDNSIFELGVAFDLNRYAEIIKELRPTHYIVPDSLEDTKHTIELYKQFTSTYPDLPGFKIGVVQGKTYQEIVECYEFMAFNCDYIAISFDYSYYQYTGRGSTKLEKMCTGRQRLISDLITHGIWRANKPHHLLGCSLPKEFSIYKNVTQSIRSVDTSNPIMCGINNMRYAPGLGVNQKPKGLLADNLEIVLTDEQKKLIDFNIMKFREIVR